MFNYVFEQYVLDGREYFVYGDREGTLTRKDFPFPQSLLLLLDLNVMEIEKIAHPIGRLIERYCQTRGAETEAQVIARLEELAAMHVYFELLPLDWKRRFERSRPADWRTTSDFLSHKQMFSADKIFTL